MQNQSPSNQILMKFQYKVILNKEEYRMSSLLQLFRILKLQDNNIIIIIMSIAILTRKYLWLLQCKTQTLICITMAIFHKMPIFINLTLHIFMYLFLTQRQSSQKNESYMNYGSMTHLPSGSISPSKTNTNRRQNIKPMEIDEN